MGVGEAVGVGGLAAEEFVAGININKIAGILNKVTIFSQILLKEYIVTPLV